MPLQIPIAKQIRPPFPIRRGCIYLSGYTIPVTVEHIPHGARVTYRSTEGGSLGVYFRFVSRCLENRKDVEDVLRKLIAKESVRI